MAITPKFKPGQLVRYSQGLHDLVGLVKSTQFARHRGDPVFVLVQWCNNRAEEEYIPQSDLKLIDQ
jgi:hypothetical protein